MRTLDDMFEPRQKEPVPSKLFIGIAWALTIDICVVAALVGVEFAVSKLAQRLEMQMMAVNVPAFVREHMFAKDVGRKFRFDYAWPDRMIACEVEGGIWTNGAHTRGKHFISDCVKYNLAAQMGWKVFRYPVNMIDSGAAIAQLETVLKGESLAQMQRLGAL